MTVKFFDGKIEKFITSLEGSTVARVLRTIDLLEMFGNKLGLPHSKKVGSHLFELRIRGKQEIRMFYAFNNGKIVLLHGFIKKSQRIPKREIEIAQGKQRALD